MRKGLKWIGIACLIPIALVLLLSLLLYLPPVQKYAVEQAAGYVAKATGMQIGIQRIRLSFPLDLSVHGVDIRQGSADTLLTLQRLSLRVHPLSLWKQQFAVRSLALEKVNVRSGTLLKGMRLEGEIGGLTVVANRIDLKGEVAEVNNALLTDAAVRLRIDSVSQQADTAASAPVNWVLSLAKVALKNVSFTLDMPEGSMHLGTHITHAVATRGGVDLARPAYEVERFSLLASRLQYDADSLPAKPGLDVAHIDLTHLLATIDSVRYAGKEMQARITSLAVNERSGLSVSSLTGVMRSDSLRLDVPNLALRTPASDIRLFATLPWSVLDEQPAGTLRTLVTATIGKPDLLLVAGDLPADFRKAYPNRPISVTAGLEGNMEHLRLQQLKARMPGAFTVFLSGEMANLRDSIRRSGTIELDAAGDTLSFFTSLLPKAQRSAFALPPGMRLTGEGSLKDRTYQARLLLKEDKASVAVDGRFNPVAESYEATLRIDSLEPVHFLPGDSLLWLTASMEAEGKGFDVFKSSTFARLEGAITDIRYGQTSVSNVAFSASLKEHQAHAELKSDYPLARMEVTLDGTLRKEAVQGMLIADVDTIDLHALHLAANPFATSFQLFADGRSNLKETHRVDISLGNWMIATEGQTFRPKLLVIKAQTDTASVQAAVSAGDLSIRLTGQAPPDRLLKQVSLFSDSLDRQLEVDTMVNLTRLHPLLPDLVLQVKAGKDNPVYNLLSEYNMGFNRFFLDAHTSPEKGITMDAEVFAAYRDTFLIDTIRAMIRPDTAGLQYNASVVKNRYRQQQPFAAHLHGSLRNAYADAELTYLNNRRDTGMHIGVRLHKEKEGARIHLFPDEPVIAFHPYRVNPDNFVRYRNMLDMEANVRLEGKKNASLWLHSIPVDGAPSELHLEIGQLNLANISNGLISLPSMQGILNADIQYVPSGETFLVAADANIDNLIYRNGRVGEVMLNAVYLPLGGKEHQADVHFFRDRQEIVTATAHYRTGKNDYLTGSLDISMLPMQMLTPFVPDGLAQLNGAVNGHVSIEGSTAKPAINGYMQLDTSSVYISSLTSRFRLDDKKIEVKNSKLDFNRYSIYGSGKNPFIINGSIDFSDLSRMTADLRLNANNMQVLDARRTSESMVYGKLFVNLATTIKGRLDALAIRGDLQLLGGTNVGYVMGESSLTVQDRLKDLVTFTSFTDTLTRTRRRQPTVPIGGMDMMMVIHIDPVVQLRADITPDQSSYVDLEGGGDLSFQYTRQGDMILNGRYTLNGGHIKYALPIIPLKEFQIKQDSYVQWDGDPMNPILNLTATERTRASVSNLGGSPQSVNFDVGVQLKDRLDDMALQFVIDAPENISVKNDLASVGPEERSKRAIAMIMTGMYLDGNSAGGTNNMNMGNALNSFLESEINHIAGDALKTVDISVGVDTYDSDPAAGGGQRTDYSFRFAKRFYNDRIRVVIGGKVSSGDVQPQQQESFIDNVSFEYRLDQAGTRYIKLFHDRNYESILEGDIMETGAGVVLRKKMLHLRELFNFRKKKVAPVPEDEPHETKKESHETPAAH